jgi:hypothetical protein
MLYRCAAGAGQASSIRSPDQTIALSTSPSTVKGRDPVIAVDQRPVRGVVAQSDVQRDGVRAGPGRAGAAARRPGGEADARLRRPDASLARQTCR